MVGSSKFFQFVFEHHCHPIFSETAVLDSDAPTSVKLTFVKTLTSCLIFSGYLHNLELILGCSKFC